MVPADPSPRGGATARPTRCFVEGAGLGTADARRARAQAVPPTASAVLGDLVVAARNRARGVVERAPTHRWRRALVAPGEVRSAFYLALEVADRPGVLAAVATVFGGHGVSIRSMEQVGLGDDARLVFLTHRATEADARTPPSAQLAALDAVDEVGAVLRVVDDADPMTRSAGVIDALRRARRRAPGTAGRHPPRGATPRCSPRRGCRRASAPRCYLKVEGANPTGASRTAA